MPTHNTRATLLHRYDHHVEMLAADAEREDLGVADKIEALNDLATTLADNVIAWASRLARLGGPSAPAFDARRVGRLVIESVFDECLEPAYCHVLTAAFDLAMSAR
jgi:hypothetical protein